MEEQLPTVSPLESFSLRPTPAGHHRYFLRNLSLAYLSLDRPAPSLSGGEAQRIRLPSQMGFELAGV
ncbi:MAG: hypothetical protein ACE5H0_12885 [Bacteroidota bacterium]